MQTVMYGMEKQGPTTYTGKYMHYPVTNHNGKEYEKEDMYN